MVSFIEKLFKLMFILNFTTLEIELVTPPLDGLILEGVTRQSIIDLARKWVN